MEKIFDIAKDSEQKWGVIAKTIDRNNENLYYYSNPTSGVIDKNDNDKINAEYNLEKAGVEDIKCI